VGVYAFLGLSTVFYRRQALANTLAVFFFASNSMSNFDGKAETILVTYLAK
jgi:hypothetical protein